MEISVYVHLNVTAILTWETEHWLILATCLLRYFDIFVSSLPMEYNWLGHEWILKDSELKQNVYSRRWRVAFVTDAWLKKAAWLCTFFFRKDAYIQGRKIYDNNNWKIIIKIDSFDIECQDKLKVCEEYRYMRRYNLKINIASNMF